MIFAYFCKIDIISVNQLILFYNHTHSEDVGSNPVTGGVKIPVAAVVQTIFFGLTGNQKNAL